MVLHHFIPEDLMTVMIVPILKKKGLDPKNKDNYRPIALATLLSKVLEKLILVNTIKCLTTTDNQFGFKRRSGCEQCIFTLKQVIDWCGRKEIPLYICYLDASKAFDNVQYLPLLKKLIENGFPLKLTNFLLIWFTKQRFQVKWGNIISDSFLVQKGVRQGGILSPYFFALYVNNLSQQLNSCRYGLTIMGKLINHLIYADDFCLLSTSKTALHKMLSICDVYATSHGLTFNSKKTQLQSFFPKWLNQLDPNTSIRFKNDEIPSVQCVRYLGYLIQQKTKWDVDFNSDEDEITRKSAEIYKRAFMIRSKFNKCSLKVKKYLFTTYLSSIYCSSLWNLNSSEKRKITVAYNNAFRIVCNFRKDCSATEMFQENQVRNFIDVRKVAIFSLSGRNFNSLNQIIEFISYSSIHGESKMSNTWNNLCNKI